LTVGAVDCPGGKRALGGGLQVLNPDGGLGGVEFFSASVPVGNPPTGWRGAVGGILAANMQRLQVFAVCATVAP
jgi:hypothetical protein